METLSCLHLSKKFGERYVINDISLKVNKGECRAILGPNGAGKTTLFNLLAGKLTPTAGQIHIFGRDVTDLAQHERVQLGLARTFQVTNLMFDLTVLDNVLLSVKAIMPFRYVFFRAEDQYARLMDQARLLLEQWGLWERRDEIVKNLSYGEQRQTELVMALASKPKILLLDEPTSGLSAAEATSFVSLIKKIKQDMTVVIVEHHMDVVFDLSDYITVLHYGVVVAEGTKDEIVASPKVRKVYLGEDL